MSFPLQLTDRHHNRRMEREADSLIELACSSWAEIEEEVVRALKTTSRFGPRKSFSRIGENNGFMSVCCLLRPDWIGDSNDDVCHLPAKIVYKFSHSGGLEAVARDFLECKLNEEVIYSALKMSNNTEGLFYSLLTPSMADWLLVPAPVCYKEVVEDGDVGNVMIEHVDGTSFECYEHCSMFEVRQIVSAVARLQSLSARDGIHHYEAFSWNPWQTIGTCVLTKKVARKVVAEIPDFYGDEFEPLTRTLLVALEDIYDIDAPMRELNILVHGDIWQSNLMWSYGCDRPRQLKSILDWQSAHVGSPAEDLVFLLCCVLSGEDRRAHWYSLLVFLYCSVSREMAPARPSFSFDELLASYHRLFPVLGLIVLMRFSVIFKFSLPNLSPERRIKFSRSMSRKLFFLAEDVIVSFENRL